MTATSPLLRSLFTGVLLGILLSGCRREPQNSASPPNPGAEAAQTTAPASATAGDLPTSPSLEETTAPRAVPETAPFYSERFLPPDQRLERRQQRIQSVLDPATTASPASS